MRFKLINPNLIIRVLFCVWIIVISTFVCPGQEIQTSPLTPHAASLGQYADIPVSLYTGIPDIQIPIYEIQIKGFKLPISLKYHGGGIKVNDIASWVGTGWTLNAGGIISRNQKGNYDEDKIDNPDHTRFETILDDCSSAQEKFDAAQRLYAGNIPSDTESDIFTFNVGNLYQKFIMDIYGDIYNIPASKIKIDYSPNRITLSHPTTGVISLFSQWNVTDENGIQYCFGKNNSTGTTDVEIFRTEGKEWSKEMISSWYLNQITLPSGEKIIFKYDNFEYTVENESEYTYNAGALDGVEYRSSIHYTKALRLKEISFPNGKIVFVPGKDRIDLVGDKALDSINIYSYAKKYALIKSYKFVTDYSSDRLFLRKIKEVKSNKESDNEYSFGYYGSLPPRCSTGQDLWGYNNGHLDNFSLLPHFLLRNENGTIIYEAGQNNNRTINTEAAKAGMLRSITYPTGGGTNFEYQSNVAKGVVKDNSGRLLTNPIKTISMLEASTEIIKKTAAVAVDNVTGYDEGYSPPFTITRESANIEIHSANIWGGEGKCDKIYPGSDNGYMYECADVFLEKVGQQEQGSDLLLFGRTFDYPPGTYRLKVKWKSYAQRGSTFRVYAMWDDYKTPPPNGDDIPENTEIEVGGLRISKISNYDSSGKETIKTFNYDFNNDDDESGSSGYIQNAPILFYKKTSLYQNRSGNWIICNPCYYLTTYLNSSILQTNGCVVGYRKVTVDYGEAGEAGRTVTYFLSPKQYPDENLEEARKWPFPESTSLDWRRGLIDKEIYFKNVNGDFTPIKTIENKYSFNPPEMAKYAATIPNIKLKKTIQSLAHINNGEIPITSVSYHLYNHKTEFFYLSKSVISEKTSKGDIITTHNYSYSPRCLKVRDENFTTSNEKNIIYATQYASDIVDEQIQSNDSNVIAIKNLILKYNKSGAPVEQFSMNGGIVNDATLTCYYADKPLPKAIYKFEPDSLGDRLFYCFVYNGILQKDLRYKLKVSYDAYDESYNLLEQHDNKGIHTSYIWGYNKTHPVVKIEGKSYSEIPENIKNKIMTHAFSGSTTYKDIVSDKEFLENELSTLIIDYNCMIMYYTYAPLIGLTSATDSNGVTTYYEYDDFNRLKYIRDNDGNIIKKYQYNYVTGTSAPVEDPPNFNKR